MTPVALLDAAGYEVMPLRGAEDAVCAHVPLTGITGYHFFTFNFFTFNEVARTEAWRQACLQRLADRRGGHPG